MTEQEKAYVAGFFDGEGCCMINPNCTVRVIIAQKNPSILQWMSAEWGGKISTATQNQNTAKLWFNGKAEILKFLSDIRPYLRGKCFEVDLAIKVLELSATNSTRPQAANGLFTANPNKAERERLFMLYRAHRDKTSKQSVALRKRLKIKAASGEEALVVRLMSGNLPT